MLCVSGPIEHVALRLAGADIVAVSNKGQPFDAAYAAGMDPDGEG